MLKNVGGDEGSEEDQTLPGSVSPKQPGGGGGGITEQHQGDSWSASVYPTMKRSLVETASWGSSEVS